MDCKNWKTIDNNFYFNTESENPILKKDEHHAEIIDITDGLVVEEQVFLNIDYGWDEEMPRVWDNLIRHNKKIKNSVWDAFGKKKV